MPVPPIPNSSGMLKRPSKPRKENRSVPTVGSAPASSGGSVKKPNPQYWGQKKKQGLVAEAKRREDLASGRAGLGPAYGPQGSKKRK